MKLSASILLCAALSVPMAVLAYPPVAHGTHAPETATQVWRVVVKGGNWGSAVPVKMLDDDTVLFLTVKHLAKHIKIGAAIVEDRTRNRKLMVLKHVDHPTSDLAVIHVKSDGAEMKLVPIDLDENAPPGLSVFSIGYPGPRGNLTIHRGYIGMWPWTSSYVAHGMSGGALLLNNGRMIALLRGYSYDDEALSVHTDETDPTLVTGVADWRQPLHVDSIVVPLAPHKIWLEQQKVL